MPYRVNFSHTAHRHTGLGYFILLSRRFYHLKSRIINAIYIVAVDLLFYFLSYSKQVKLTRWYHLCILCHSRLVLLCTINNVEAVKSNLYFLSHELTRVSPANFHWIKLYNVCANHDSSESAQAENFALS